MFDNASDEGPDGARRRTDIVNELFEKMIMGAVGSCVQTSLSSLRQSTGTMKGIGL